MDQRAGGCRTLLSCILNAIVFDRKPSSPACCCSSSTMGRPIAIMSATAAVSEPEAVVSCFEDVAVMSEAVEGARSSSGRHRSTMVPWQWWR
jgi:hypothetical protein